MKMNNREKRINDIVRSRLLLLAVVAFIATILILGHLQTVTAEKNTNKVLAINVADVKHDILDASDENLLLLAEVAKYSIEHPESVADDNGKIPMGNDLMDSICELYGLNDTLVVDKKGIIKYSSYREFVGYDMASGEQSAEFLCLLDGTESLVQAYGPISYDSAVYRKFAGVPLDGGGFVQVSYDAERFRKDIDEDVLNITKNRHVGENGYIMIISDDGDIVSSPYLETLGHNLGEYGISIERIAARMNDEPFTDEFAGEVHNCLGSQVEGYFIFAVMPQSETLLSRNTAIAMTTVMESVIFVAMFLMIYGLLRHLVINNINDVAESLDKIADGDLDVIVDVRGNKEFDSLSDGINTTVATLKQHIADEAARIDAELEYAKTIQRNALPSVFPPFPERDDFEIYASMTPAKEVGGDFFDFELMDNTRLGFCIADVSGKGIPAALFMMRAKTLIKNFGLAGFSADEILWRVNNELCENNESGMFVTCWLAILNTETGELQYSSAGHNPPLICRSGGEYEYIRGKNGFVLAGMENTKYRSETICLSPGDRLYLYTDGVTEATSTENELFGEDRLKQSLDKLRKSSTDETCSGIYSDIGDFVGSAPQFDDITMLSLIYNGKTEKAVSRTFPASLDCYNEFISFIEETLETAGCPLGSIMKINVASDEIFANVSSYAYGEGNGDISVSILPLEKPDGVRITFTDSGMPFNPLDAPVPDTELSAEERKIGGLGIYMIRETMDNVEYEYKDGTNNFSIIKYF